MGIDSGATLVKLCVRSPAGDRYFATWPSPSRDRVLEVLMELAPERLGITGCGAAGLLAGLDRGAANPIEFDAWGRGANEILAQTGQISDEPYLLVSIGTGTSALRVEGDRVERVDGTALGGGTALGLGLALTGCQTHDELARLAARGERGGVDLLISDIYEKNALPIAAEATAASFGKLAHALDRERDGQFERTGSIPSGDPSGDRRRSVGPSARPEDLAAAVMGLVAENIALLSNARATVAGVRRIVYGGSTLYENPTLVGTVQLLTSVMGFEVIVLPHSGHAGALGAMLLSD
jgi:type II pantothenate kinase